MEQVRLCERRMSGRDHTYPRVEDHSVFTVADQLGVILWVEYQEGLWERRQFMVMAMDGSVWAVKQYVMSAYASSDLLSEVRAERGPAQWGIWLGCPVPHTYHLHKIHMHTKLGRVMFSHCANFSISDRTWCPASLPHLPEASPCWRRPQTGHCLTWPQQHSPDQVPQIWYALGSWEWKNSDCSNMPHL